MSAGHRAMLISGGRLLLGGTSTSWRDNRQRPRAPPARRGPCTGADEEAQAPAKLLSERRARERVPCAALSSPVVLPSPARPRAEETGGGTGVADKPASESPSQKQQSRRESFTGPPYKVLLHDDSVNRREFVVRILLKVVDDLSMDEAVSIMQTAHEQGVSVVVTVAQQVRCLSTTNTSE